MLIDMHIIYIHMFIKSITGSRRQTAVIAGGVGGTLTAVVIVVVVFLVYRRYTFKSVVPMINVSVCNSLNCNYVICFLIYVGLIFFIFYYSSNLMTA